MASSAPSPEAPISEDGFATPLAVVVSLALATLAVAVQARAIEALHASQADYVRTAAELRSDGAQELTAAALAAGTLAAARETKLSFDGVAVNTEVQPEAAKLDLLSASRLDDATLKALGADHPDGVRASLARLAATGSAMPADIRAIDPSAAWKACAPDVMSAYGAGRGAFRPPADGAIVAHAGEVWRVVTHDAWGWTQDRVVRITGEARSPSRIISRSFLRNLAGRRPCPTLAAAAPAA